MASGLSIAATALIPVGGVMACFLLGFLRGVTGAWPEFLLGLTLIDQARQISGQYAETAGKFQAQAATARNVGSLVAHGLAFGLFAIQQLMAAPSELSDATANMLLIATGLLSFVAAFVAFKYRVGLTTARPRENFEAWSNPLAAIPRSRSYDSCSDSSSEGLDCESPLPISSSMVPIDTTNYNILLVVFLQVVIVLFSLRGIIVTASSELAWGAMASTAAVCLIGSTWMSVSTRWERAHRVGLFLILRHSLPSISYVMGSYFYTLFAQEPAFLQFVSVSGTFMTTLASWSYGRILSPYSQGKALRKVIAGTTVLASIASLLNLVFVHFETWQASWWTRAGVAIAARAVMTVAGEWAFLPDVILATVSAVPDTDNVVVGVGTMDVTEPSFELVATSVADALLRPPLEPLVAETGALSTSSADEDRLLALTESDSKVDIQYGTLISCIDFGDQLGSLLAGPVVAALGISRENDWEGLDQLIMLSCMFGLLSIGFLTVLPK